ASLRRTRQRVSRSKPTMPSTRRNNWQSMPDRSPTTEAEAAINRKLTLGFSQLLHGPPGVIHHTIRIGVSAGISIGDCDFSKGFACHFAWSFAAFEPELVPERVVFVRVTMRPAVYGDRSDIASRVKAASAECTRQLV